MRTSDAIKGEIGQLEDQIRKHENRVAQLKDEFAESTLTAWGWKLGQIVEYRHGDGTRQAKVVGFRYAWGCSLACLTIKKNGELGSDKLLSEHDLKHGSVKIIKDVDEVTP